MSLDIITKSVATVSALTLMIIAIRKEIRDSRAEWSKPTNPSTVPHPRLRLLIFVAAVISIAFFTTLLTQYLYPPYGVYAPAGYKPLLSHAAVMLLWMVGLSTLLLVVVFQKRR